MDNYRCQEMEKKKKKKKKKRYSFFIRTSQVAYTVLTLKTVITSAANDTLNFVFIF